MTMQIYTDGGIHTETNINKCTNCPFNPFREDDEDIYTLEDGEDITIGNENA